MIKNHFHFPQKDPREDLRYGSARRFTARGFTLPEVIVAITLITIGIAASLLLISRTVGQMAISSSQLIATYLSQEGIEIVRNIRDTNWLEGAPTWDEGLGAGDWQADYDDQGLSSYDGSPLCIDANGFYKYIDTTCPGATLTKFKRKITIVPGADTLTVTVETTWTEKGRTYTHKAQEVLYNWK